MNDEFRKYASYAIGEVLLVIVGILIALQIDNWNEDRKQQASLQGYLETIAWNMEEDLRELELLREQRYRHLAAITTYQFLRGQSEYSPEDIFLAYRGLVDASAELFFSANTSGYDMIKTSDVLGRLQGTGIDKLLSAYYDKVGRIELLERSQAEYVRVSNTEYIRTQPKDLEMYAFSNPTALSPERFTELQAVYRDMIGSPVWQSFIATQGRVERLVQLYESLGHYADALNAAITRGKRATINTMPITNIDRWQAGEGLPVLIGNGRVALENYWLAGVSSPVDASFGASSFHYGGEELRISHDGRAEWASVYMGLEGVDVSSAGRLGLDFSAYRTLELELKGSVGGETLQVAIKDAEYPDYKAPVGPMITLGEDWQIYEIPLSEFAPNDLTRIAVPLSFNFAPATEPAAFSVRNARYR